MTMRSDLWAYLTTSGNALETLISDRLYATNADEITTLPYVVYEQEASTGTNHLTLPSALVRDGYVFRCFGTTPKEAHAVNEALRKVLDGMRGLRGSTDFRRCMIGNVDEVPGKPTDGSQNYIYQVEVDYDLWYYRDVPNNVGGFTNSLSIDSDGVDDFMSISDPGIGTGAFTMSGWAKTTTSAGDYFMGKIGTPNFALGASSGKATMLIGSEVLSGTTTVNDDSWYHIVGTRSSGGTTKIYVNGTLENTGSDSADGNGTWNLIRGAGTGNGWPGRTDELAIWVGTELSASKVSDLYNEGIPTDLSLFSTIPTHWWRNGDGDTFPTITDQIGSNDATMTNMDSGDIVSDVP